MVGQWFYSNPLRIIVIVFCAIGLVLLTLLGFQIAGDIEDAKEMRYRILSEHGAGLDSALKANLNQVDLLRRSGESFLRENTSVDELPPDPRIDLWLNKIVDGFYSFDNLPVELRGPDDSNLVAMPPERLRNTGFQRGSTQELMLEGRMALSLTNLFRLVRRQLGNAGWIYYTSKSGFINIYPWAPGKDAGLSEETADIEFYKLGLPANNPNRKHFWSNVYTDQAGLGLMVTLGAPLYKNDQFLGTVAVDLTLEDLNNFVRSVDGTRQFFIVNRAGQLLAHPKLINQKQNEVTPAANAFSEEIRATLPGILKKEFAGYMQTGDSLIAYRPLTNAPWILMEITPIQNIWAGILIGYLPIAVGLVAAIGILLIATIRVLNRAFNLRQETESLLRESEERFRFMVETLPTHLVITRIADQTVLYANQRATELFGIDKDRAVGTKAPDYYVDPNQRSLLVQEVRRQGQVRDFEVLMKRGNGEHFWALVSAAQITYANEPVLLVSITDISERKAMEEELRRRATIDALTQIPNRQHFLDLAEGELRRAQRYQTSLSVLLIDIDRFKFINDTYGHAVGDHTLQLMTKVCIATLRESDVIGRIGGEEFAVVLPTTTPEGSKDTAERLRRAVELATVEIPGVPPLKFTISIGIASLRSSDTQVKHILERADLALYEAKRAGRNRISVWQAPA